MGAGASGSQPNSKYEEGSEANDDFPSRINLGNDENNDNNSNHRMLTTRDTRVAENGEKSKLLHTAFSGGLDTKPLTDTSKHPRNNNDSNKMMAHSSKEEVKVLSSMEDDDELLEELMKKNTIQDERRHSFTKSEKSSLTTKQSSTLISDNSAVINSIQGFDSFRVDSTVNQMLKSKKSAVKTAPTGKSSSNSPAPNNTDRKGDKIALTEDLEESGSDSVHSFQGMDDSNNEFTSNINKSTKPKKYISKSNSIKTSLTPPSQGLVESKEDRASFVDESEEVDLNPMDVLFQYIPYYGQGDPANDSTVRATLQGLGVEDIDKKDENGNTLLILACQYRCEDLVRIMLNKGADPNAVNISGACCLHFACYQDSASKAIAKILLQNGANPEIREVMYGCTPLHYCSSNSDIDFCKLLISYGSVVSTRDYYNYTSVDYARNAGNALVARYLQDELLKSSVYDPKSMSNNASNFRRTEDTSVEWNAYVDQASGYTYYADPLTGECLWEEDYLKKKKLAPPTSAKALPYPNPLEGNQRQMTLIGSPNDNLSKQSNGNNGTSNFTGNNNSDSKSPSVIRGSKDLSKESKSESKGINDAKIVTKTIRLRLMAFLGEYDGGRLDEVDSLMTQYKGKEKELLKELCLQYKQPIKEQLEEFEMTYKRLGGTGNATTDVQPESTPSESKSSTTKLLLNTVDVFSSSGTLGSKKPTPPPPTPTMNGSAGAAKERSYSIHSEKYRESEKILSEANAILQTQLAESKKKYEEAELNSQRLLAEMREKYEEEIAEQRKRTRDTVGDQVGDLSKVNALLDAMMKERDALQAEKTSIMRRLEDLQSERSKSSVESQQELAILQKKLEATVAELAHTQSQLSTEQGRLRSLEDSLASVASSDTERVAAERKAAEQRALEQRERDKAHADELALAQEQASAVVAKLKEDFLVARSDWEKADRDVRIQHDEYRRGKEAEVETLCSEIAQLKSRMAKELSEKSEALEAAARRIENAENSLKEQLAANKLLQNEVDEARPLVALNAQLHRDLAREQAARKRLHNEMEDLKGKIRVYVRIRPFSRTEEERCCEEAVVKDGKQSVMVKGIGAPDARKNFDFDQVFGGSENNSQEDIFKDTKHLILSVIDGYNVCIFAYGQTGSGKTFTMMGAADIANCVQPNGMFDPAAGILPRAVVELFRLLSERQAQVQSTVEVQMFQLYRDGLEDLLFGGVAGGKKKKKTADEEERPNLRIVLAEHSSTGLVQVEGAESIIAESAAEVMRIVAVGTSRRTTACTNMNAESSRSHLICVLVVKLENRRTQTVSVGKLTLVDLAGSERVDKSGATGDVLKEAQSINKSLSALGGVISALTSGSQHIPYRDHALTMLMSDSIGGNAKTLMFVNCSPADYNNVESNSSLSFAIRCKDITNQVAAPQAGQQVKINALKKELAKLKKTEKGPKTGAVVLTRPQMGP